MQPAEAGTPACSMVEIDTKAIASPQLSNSSYLIHNLLFASRIHLKNFREYSSRPS